MKGKKADDKMRKSRERRRTKKLQEEKKGRQKQMTTRNSAWPLSKMEVSGRNIDHQLWSASLILHYMHLITYILY